MDASYSSATAAEPTLFSVTWQRVCSAAWRWIPGLAMVFSASAIAAVGSTPGSFNAGGNGDAGYSIPITVPPGTAGMQPSLSLGYSSGVGNTIAGMGWNLNGISSIARCPQTQATDGVRGGINLDANDRFCLDGKRLIVVAGAYGGDGAEYRTEIESFAKVVSYGAAGTGPAWFKVWTKNGQILEFGNTTDSRILAAGAATVLTWAQNNTSDRKGNYFNVSYVNNNAAGEHYPARIDYTGNAAAALTPYASVQFAYQARPDVEKGYVAGSVVQTSQRLTNIKTYVGATLVKSYNLSYQAGTATGRSRLTSLQECDGAADCLPATTFAWQEGGQGFTMQRWATQQGGYWDTQKWFVGDFNGDGKTDFANVFNDGGSISIDVHLSNGSSFSSARWATQQGVYSDTQKWFVGDFNGDGKIDFARVVDDGGSASIDVYLSSGSGFSMVRWATQQGGYWDTQKWFVGDFNGDGKTDLAKVFDGGGSANIDVHLSSGSGFSMVRWATQQGGYSDTQKWFVGDFNGDGKTDFANLFNDGGSASIDVHLSSGSGFSMVRWATQQGGYSDTQKWFVGDFNGDGKTDFANLFNDGGSASIDVHLSSGSAFSSARWATQQGGYSDTQKWSAGDFNGDGKTDFAKVFNDSNAASIDTHFTPNFPDLLTRITNGLGLVTTVSYKPLTDASVYTRDTNAAYPVVDLQNAEYVVSSVSVENGVGGTSTTSYTYGGQKTDVNGRDLGFRWREALNTGTGIRSRSDFSQTYPTNGMPTYIKTTLVSSGVILTETTNTLTAQALGGTRYLPYASNTVDKRYEINGSLITSHSTSQTLDAYGNPTSETVTNSGGGSTWMSVTTNTYTNDAVNWFLGRLTQTSVTNTLPGGANATRVASFAYDAATGLMTQEVVEPNIAALKQTTAYTYDAFGNRITATVSGSSITSHTSSVGWSSNGRFPVSATNAVGHVETRVYESNFGNRTSLTDSNGQSTSWAYDTFGRKIGETRPDGTSTYVSLAVCGICPTYGAYAVTTSAIGTPTSKTYVDKLERTIRSETQGFDGTLIYQDTQYNSLGQVAKVSRPYYAGATAYWTTYVYDVIGRVTIATEPSGGVIATSYSGLSTTVTNPLNQSKTKVIDPLGRLKSVTEAAGTTNYTYDPFGNLLTTTDPLGNVVAMSYNIRGFKTGMTDPDLGSWSYTYNELGQLTSQTDAKGQATSYTYDVLGRLTKRGQPGKTDTWTYDTATKGKGKIATASTDTGYSRTHTYDSIGRPSGITYTVDTNFTNMAMSTTYDTAGRVATVTYPTGFAVKYVYNTYGHLAEVRNNATLYWQANARNADGLLTKNTLGNSLNSNYTYSPTTGNLTRVITGVSNGSGVQDYNYGYDLGSNLTSRNDATLGVMESFTYDNMNRLTQAKVTAPVTVTKTYTYNAIGNLMSKSDTGTYTYHATKKHAVASIAGAINTTLTYDANGNMLTGNGRTLTWTSWNMIASNSGAGGGYWYDAEHNRIKMSYAGGGNTYYINPRWDVGVNFEKEMPAVGGVLYRHSIYAGSGAPVAVYTSGTTSAGQPISNIRYLHMDNLGSVAIITDESGAVVERRSYDPHGRLRNTNGSDATTSSTLKVTPHSYTGHEYLDNPWVTNCSCSGLINMNGRIYDPQIGRFMSADPYIQALDASQSLNRYSYVNNNPLSHTDPSGYWSLKKAFKSITHAITAVVKAVLVPTPQHIFNAIAALPGQALIDKVVMNTPLLYAVGQVVATVVTEPFCGGCGGAAWSAYYTYQATGSTSAALKAGAITYATTLGTNAVSSQYGNSWSAGRVAASSAVGGISAKLNGGDFEDGFKTAFAFSMLTYGNYMMRQEMVAQSRLNEANANGVSKGFFGDNFKLGGGRREYFQGIPLPCDAPLGGCQGAPNLTAGDVGARFGPISYQPGGILDAAVESFAGPHDFFRNLTGAYTAQGNSVTITSSFGKFTDAYVMNFGNLLPAAPFAAAAVVQTYTPTLIAAPKLRKEQQ